MFRARGIPARSRRRRPANCRVSSSPPPASAQRRAMSRPRPVEPRSLRPRTTAVVGQPGPVVGDLEPRAVVGRAEASPRTAVPSGVCAMTFSSRASTAAARSSPRARTGSGLGRQRDVAARGPGRRPAPTRTSTRSPTTAVASHGRHPALALRAAGGADHRGERALERADVRADPLGLDRVAQRLGVQAQRGQRGAQPVREVGDGLAFLGDQLVDAVGQPVQRRADLGDLARSVGRAPAR